ncbi:MAG: helix-turn-helix domain-containing protein [Nitrosomonas sp.]|nr:helix-turn-helix domain-containing protein [Nitrosomonas sp.]
MKEWFSPQELAGLIGMPVTPSGVIRWAKKNLIKTRKKLRSKAIEYHLLDLPRITQSYIAQNGLCFESESAACAESTQAGSPLPVDADIHESAGGFSGSALPSCLSSTQVDDEPVLSGSAVSLSAADTGTFLESKIGMVMDTIKDANHDARIKEAQRRLEIITPILKLPERFPGRRAFAEGIARENKTSPATIYRWVKDYRAGGFLALVDKNRADLGQARVLVSAQFERVLKGLGMKSNQVANCAEWLLQKVRALWAAGGTSHTQVWSQAVAMLGLKLIDDGMDEISARAIAKISHPKRFVEAEAHYRLVATNDRNAKEVYDKHRPAVSRSRKDLLPGDLVFGDVSPVDIPVLRPDGSTAYARMIAWMDAAVNWLFTSLYLCPPATGVRQEHVALSFSSSCESAPFGMAKRLYLDNGSEYKWEDMLKAWSELARLTGNQTHVEIMSQMPPAGKIVRSIPFQPRGKLIEGAFGNLRYFFGWHPAFQGGNRMAKRCANLGEAVKPVPFEELQQFLAAAMADYHATPQGGHLNGKSPQEALDAHLQNGWRPTRVDKEVLLLAFADQRERTVRGGIINHGGREWYADFLVGLNKKVEVRYPKHDPQCLFVFDQGKFMGVALPEQEFGLLDNAGAVEAGRRRAVLREAIKNMAGQVETIQVSGAIGSRGKLMGVDETVTKAHKSAEQVQLSDEALKILAAKKKALEQKTMDTLNEAAKKAVGSDLTRWKPKDDPEMDVWRAKYEDD